MIRPGVVAAAVALLALLALATTVDARASEFQPRATAEDEILAEEAPEVDLEVTEDASQEVEDEEDDGQDLKSLVDAGKRCANEAKPHEQPHCVNLIQTVEADHAHCAKVTPVHKKKCYRCQRLFSLRSLAGRGALKKLKIVHGKVRFTAPEELWAMIHPGVVRGMRRASHEQRRTAKHLKRTRAMAKALGGLVSEASKLPNRQWLRDIQKLAGPGEDVEWEWRNKIMKKAHAMKLPPPKHVKIPKTPPPAVLRVERRVKRAKRQVEPKRIKQRVVPPKKTVAKDEKIIEAKDRRVEKKEERKVIEEKAKAAVRYFWHVGHWGRCSQRCGGGHRKRSVRCVSSHTKVVKSTLCSEFTRPVDTQRCNITPCRATKKVKQEEAQEEREEQEWEEKREEKKTPAVKKYIWKAGKARCSKRCQGTYTTPVTCHGENGAKVSSKKCTGKKPATKGGKCGRRACSVADYRTIYRECRGGNWTHCLCPKGYTPLTGGCDAESWPHRFQYNGWNGKNGWLCGGHGGRKKVHVICSRSLGACKWSTTDGGDWHRNNCPAGAVVASGGCNAIRHPWISRWSMMSGNGWLCGGWGGAKRTSTLCCDQKSMRKGCKVYRRKFGDWGHMSCPKGMKLLNGGCDSDKPYLVRTSRPLNRHTWQCGGWGGAKLITIKCCPQADDY